MASVVCMVGGALRGARSHSIQTRPVYNAPAQPDRRSKESFGMLDSSLLVDEIALDVWLLSPPREGDEEEDVDDDFADDEDLDDEDEDDEDADDEDIEDEEEDGEDEEDIDEEDDEDFEDDEDVDDEEEDVDDDE